MEKGKISRNIFNLDIDNLSIEDAINCLNNLDCPKESRITFCTSWEGDTSFYVTWQEVETDEEYMRRTQREAAMLEDTLKRERAQYLALKAKFEGTP